MSSLEMHQPSCNNDTSSYNTSTKPSATTTSQSEPYTIKLTGTALAKSLKLSGQNPTQVALEMGIYVKAV